MADEETPLLSGSDDYLDNPHKQFCMLIGIPPSDQSDGTKWPTPNTTALYERAIKKRSSQKWTYAFTASLSNTLLLTQMVFGAALTGLGASGSSHVLITVFGAMNTIIAGLVAYLKSRGQPMRARMFRDDLERVVDEIENSEIMWLGITKGIHGYDEIDVDKQVSVRSEVARLTRLYERAVKNDTHNNPDNYIMTGVSDALMGLRSRPAPDAPANPPVPAAQTPTTAAPGPDTVASPPPAASGATAPAASDPDDSPATSAKPPAIPKDGTSSETTVPQAAAGSSPPPATEDATPPPAGSALPNSTAPAPPAAPAKPVAPPKSADEDQSPATAP